MSKQILSIFLALILVFASFGTSGCTSTQFESVLNEIAPAVGTILQIIALVEGSPANLSLQSKVASDVSGIETLYNDLQKADAAAKPGVEAQINSMFNALENDLSTVFALAQVKDTNTQAKLSALIALIGSAIQIAEAAVPGVQPAAVSKAHLNSAVLKLSASQMVDSYNKVLVAKTGNEAVDKFTPKHKLHLHSRAVRVLSFGFAH